MPRPPDGHPLHGATDDAGLITDLHPARASTPTTPTGRHRTGIDTEQVDTEPVDIRSLLPEPVDAYLDRAAATAEDVTVLAPDVPADAADRLAAAVTGLDGTWPTGTPAAPARRSPSSARCTSTPAATCPRGTRGGPGTPR